jgi:hypothetical protein
MTILAELRAEIRIAWQRSPTQTVLWLDPQREWERLLDQLATELENWSNTRVASWSCG